MILSEPAMDGTLGLVAIKGEGGIAFAREPQSDKYDGMPASAIAVILPPDGIARELDRIRQHPFIAGSLESASEDEHTGESFLAQVFRLPRRSMGVDFSEYKPPTIDRRINVSAQ